MPLKDNAYLHGMLIRHAMPFMLHVGHQQGIVKLHSAFWKDGVVFKKAGTNISYFQWLHLPGISLKL